MIKYIEGNLFDSKADVLAHGVNCMGAFGAGVAAQMRRRYPEVFRAYLTKYQFDGWKLGDCQIVNLETKKVANLATQMGYGYPRGERVFVNYKALRHAVRSLLKYCHKNNYSVALPQIGGDWSKIKHIIEDEAEKYPDVDITIYSLLPEQAFKLI